ncbi:hypothetical protein BH10PSE12_BH10PSE12_37090 [soil metagenome]
MEASCQARADALRGDIGCAFFLGIAGADAGWVAIDALIGDAAADWTCVEPATSDIAAIVYTSGTTDGPRARC